MGFTGFFGNNGKEAKLGFLAAVTNNLMTLSLLKGKNAEATS